MNTTKKEINDRKQDIEEQLESLFNGNMKITDWDVPEADDQKAAEMILDILQNKLNEIKQDVKEGKYKFY
jgi:hypothetical protein